MVRLRPDSEAVGVTDDRVPVGDVRSPDGEPMPGRIVYRHAVRLGVPGRRESRPQAPHERLASSGPYYSDQRGPEPEGMATQLARQLADPKPADARTIGQLGRYKGLAERIGTSRSRLSTYMSGKVVPSATLIVRMRRVARHASERTNLARRTAGPQSHGRPHTDAPVVCAR
jgi:hypothetical protein